MRRRSDAARTLVSVVAAVLFSVACAASAGAGTAKPVTGSFVGRLSGTNAFVAVVAGKGRVVAYVCDSKRLAVWLGGPLRNGRVDLRAHGLRLGGRLTQSSAVGTVTLRAGRTLSFRALRADGRAGLYTAVKSVRGVLYRAGWIVLPDGRQRGAVKQKNVEHDVIPAPPLAFGDGSVRIDQLGAFDASKLTDPSIVPVTETVDA
jgi:hypothetical protein